MAPTEKHMGKEAAEPQRDWRMIAFTKGRTSACRIGPATKVSDCPVFAHIPH
jgi:hypothetical protein